MEIPGSTLNQLKCSKCDNILSQAPVYRLADGSALCKSCYQPDQPAFRDYLYETLATHFVFPCKNLMYGCNHNIPFSPENTPSTHEKGCKLHACPLGISSVCKWQGLLGKIEEHCKDQHENIIVFNPLTFLYNVSNDSCEIFLVRAFQQLFLLKILFFKDSPTFLLRSQLLVKETGIYKISVIIKRGNQLIMKEDNVPVHDLNHESSVLKLDTGESTEPISITTILHHADDTALDSCPTCGTFIQDMYYRDYDGWWCEDCAPNKETCHINTCLYLDFPLKCSKHSKYFCSLLTKCCICDTEITDNIMNHYTSSHDVVDSTWRASDYNVEKWCLISGEVGPVLCRYELHELGFELVLLYPMKSSCLKDLACEVQITQPDTEETKCFILAALYDDESDWYIDVKKQNFATWNQYLDVSVNIYKKQLLL